MRVLMSGIALLVIFFLPAAVLVSMEIRLSKKKPALLGLIPIFLMVAAIITSALTMKAVYGGDTVKRLTEEMENGMTAQMYIREDESGSVQAYSAVEIVDQEGVLRDVSGIYFDELNGERMPPYADVFSSMIGDREVKARYVLEQEIVTDPDQIVFWKGNRCTIIDNGKTYILILYFGLPLAAIYGFNRMQLRKSRISGELRKMGIENL